MSALLPRNGTLAAVAMICRRNDVGRLLPSAPSRDEAFRYCEDAGSAVCSVNVLLWTLVLWRVVGEVGLGIFVTRVTGELATDGVGIVIKDCPPFADIRM